MADYQRPKEGFRFKFGGVKLNSTPDSLSPTKYAAAQNIRALTDSSLQTRPGMAQLFTTAAATSPVTDIHAYSVLGTDDKPRFLARSAADAIYLDNSTKVENMVPLPGGGHAPGAAMIPFRPAQSPNPYMYVATASDYRKYSAPDGSNVVLPRNVGIAEPPTPPDVGVSAQLVSIVGQPSTSSGYTNGGTAGAITNGSRVTGHVYGVFDDPAPGSAISTIQLAAGASSGNPVQSVSVIEIGSGYTHGATASFSGGGGSGAAATVHVENHAPYFVTGITVTSGGSGYTTPPAVAINPVDGFGDGATAQAFLGGDTPVTSSYQRQMVISVSGGLMVVQDVFPPLPTPLTLQAIYYYVGSSGRCVIVPANLSAGPGTEGQSLYDETLVAALRRGALVQIGSEVCCILSTSVGPDGSISFETTTVSTHTTSDTIQGVPAISVLGAPASGDSITSADITFSVSSGIGTVDFSITSNPFLVGNASFQPDDYLHFSINVGTLANINEIKFLIDVGDGSFTQNFYYYTVRPNDISEGLNNSLTQLGVAQLVTQRAVIDEETSAESGNQGPTSSGAQTTPGDGQWSEIMFSLNELTRVGNDQTVTLQNANSFQLLINASGTVAIAANSYTVVGGYQPDVGDSGAPYLYRVRPRSTVTGVKGNPSPATRYGVNPRRQQVTLTPPSNAYDTQQIDTWDVFRYGGTITAYRFIGTTPAGTAFIDNYSDEAAAAGAILDFDNYQPWPTIDVPLNATATSVTGTTAKVNIPSPTNVTKYLPGNLVQLGGGNVFTLWTRPTIISGTTYLFQFLENAGALTNVAATIYEPALASQRLPYMWGPDADGVMYACGDPLRLGTCYFSKPNDPDSAPDSYNQEIVPPSEPLLGGEILDGVSYAASTERWWRAYPQLNNPAQRYSFVQQPIPRGLAAPYGHCTDGASIYFWAKDGVWSSQKGSLTDADLYNLFPHEGVPGVSVTYNGIVYQPPDYSRAGTFRLEYRNNYLYATYQDSSGVYHTLVLDVQRTAWQQDLYATSVSVIYAPEQQAGTVLTSSALYPALLFGTINGIIGVQQSGTGDFGSAIFGAVATMEWDGGDIRAGEQWGDLYIDLVPAAHDGVLIVPMAFGAPVATGTTITRSTTRVQYPISLGGELLSDFLGMMLTWSDHSDELAQGPTILHAWQPSFLPKPENINDRISDWYSADGPDEGAGAAWWQGFILHADTFGTPKTILVRDADTMTTHAYTPVVNHNGEQSKAYSFNTPFIAHLVRLEPNQDTQWRFFDIEWIAQPTPEAAETWQTQGTSFGFNGYSHIQRIVGAYAATTPVTLTITSFDGQSPAAITLPSTGGAYQKLLQVLTANKGQLFFFKASAAAPFQLYLDDFEVQVGNWGRMDGYLNYKNLGGKRGDKAAV